MKRSLWLISALILLVSMEGKNQDFNDRPLVAKAKYFDQTPPLREMKIVLPGERDRSWKDNIIQNKSVEDSIRNQQADIPAGFQDPVLQQNYPTSREVMGPVVNIDGIGNVNGVYPPDTDGDVGPNHYFQMINLSFSIWDKSGNLLYGPADNSTLWSGFAGPWTGTNDGDPIVLYDELADRWMASQFAINTSNGTYWQLIAVSQSADPLGSYFRYAFQMEDFNDYPKLSVWPDAYYATFNMFGVNTRAGVAAFQRDSMLVGSPDAQMVYRDGEDYTFSMLPADFDGTPPPAGSPCYFAHLNTYSTHTFEIYEFSVDWDDPYNSTFELTTLLQPASFNPNISNITQPGTSTTLDALNMMLMYRLQYRNFGTYEAMVTNHTVNAGGRAGIRWYEFRKESGDWYIYQQGTYSPDSEHRWMASVAIAGNGNIAIGFNKSSSTTYPSVYYTGRTPDAPLGTMNISEVMISAGTTSQSGINRWGDYSCLSVDPSDDTTFWFTTEVHRGGWKTRIASFDFGPILPPTVSAGSDTTVCMTEPFQTSATAAYQQSVFWESEGDGIFLDPYKVQAIYLRGQGDVSSGQVQLKVTAFGYNQGDQVADSLILSFDPIAEANAGPDTVVCAGESVLLNGSAVNYDSIMWTTDGDGTFSVDTILSPVYTPGEQDIAKGYAYLWLNAYDIAPCDGFDRDRMKLNIDECTSIGEAADGKPGLVVIPNPTTGWITFEASGLPSSGSARVILYDSQGQQVFGIQLNASGGRYSNQMDLSRFARGVYYLKLITDKETLTRKVVLQ